MPLKRAVLPLLDEVDATAQTVGAVNTVLLAPGHRHGANTDVTGLVAALAAAGAGGVAGAAPGSATRGRGRWRGDRRLGARGAGRARRGLGGAAGTRRATRRRDACRPGSGWGSTCGCGRSTTPGRRDRPVALVISTVPSDVAAAVLPDVVLAGAVVADVALRPVALAAAGAGRGLGAETVDRSRPAGAPGGRTGAADDGSRRGARAAARGSARRGASAGAAGWARRIPCGLVTPDPVWAGVLAAAVAAAGGLVVPRVIAQAAGAGARARAGAPRPGPGPSRAPTATAEADAVLGRAAGHRCRRRCRTPSWRPRRGWAVVRRGRGRRGRGDGSEPRLAARPAGLDLPVGARRGAGLRRLAHPAAPDAAGRALVRGRGRAAAGRRSRSSATPTSCCGRCSRGWRCSPCSSCSGSSTHAGSATATCGCRGCSAWRWAGWAGPRWWWGRTPASCSARSSAECSPCCGSSTGGATRSGRSCWSGWCSACWPAGGDLAFWDVTRA